MPQHDRFLLLQLHYEFSATLLAKPTLVRGPGMGFYASILQFSLAQQIVERPLKAIERVGR